MLMLTLVKVQCNSRDVQRGTKCYTPYEGLNLANLKRRKLGVFDRKLEGSHYPFYCFSDKYWC